MIVKYILLASIIISLRTSLPNGVFSSGVYFYRLQAGDFIETKKLVVVK